MFGFAADLERSDGNYERLLSPLVDLEDDVRQCIHLILATPPGTLPLTRDFGCRLQQFFYGPMTEARAEAAKWFIREALQRWEPRVKVDSIDVRTSAQGTELRITVRYRLTVDQAKGGEISLALGPVGALA
jgi:phage baseplate assembly protein W